MSDSHLYRERGFPGGIHAVPRESCDRL